MYGRNMKKCKLCRVIKNENEFYFETLRKTREMVPIARCKKCCLDICNRVHRLVKTMYLSNKYCAKRRNMNPPTYTEEWLKDWLYNQDLFFELHNKWVIGGYNRKDKVSIDRIDDTISYTPMNIRLCTWEENDLKAKYKKKSWSTQKRVGVIFRESRGVWVSMMYINGKYRTLYYGHSEDDAVNIRAEFEKLRDKNILNTLNEAKLEYLIYDIKRKTLGAKY